MNTSATLIRLEAWLQEELAAQGRLAELLGRQESAIRGGDDPALIAVTAELEAELSQQPRRAQKRGLLLAELSRHWGVPANALRLTEICERAAGAGIEVERLARLREEVRRATAGVLRRGRRVATLARYHQGLLGELMSVLFDEGSGDRSDQPRLVDAQA